MDSSLNARRGFTLIEVMITIVILGLLLATAVGAYKGYQSFATQRLTKINLGALKNAIKMFDLAMNQYPKRLDDLIERPKGEAGKNWHKFLEGESIPKDGWNNDFYYRVDSKNKQGYELYSYGPNGPEGASPDEYIHA